MIIIAAHRQISAAVGAELFEKRPCGEGSLILLHHYTLQYKHIILLYKHIIYYYNNMYYYTTICYGDRYRKASAFRG